MALGDVWTFDFGMGRKQIPLRPGRFLVVAKAWFQQASARREYVSFGYLQLIFGYGRLLHSRDEGVAYLGALGWADPSDPSTIESTRGGAVVVDAVIDVVAQPGPKPEPGRLVVQAGAQFAKLHNGRLVVIEIAKINQPTSFRFAVPLSAVSGLETPAEVRQRLGNTGGGGKK